MDEEIHEELLFEKTLETDTKDESIFKLLGDFFQEKSIPFTNIISEATDGAPAMVGRYLGYSSCGLLWIALGGNSAVLSHVIIGDTALCVDEDRMTHGIQRNSVIVF
ncbi:unnamed protein product [Diatraea saccharalis]|uniref:Uncharacterized protein n=1 Tax=Diatraea saccharalis TaxID=40085 RepID=A0A9N9WHQ4_9NEOP|nr:unnamed protein product [Diatraea saccharalis]